MTTLRKLSECLVSAYDEITVVKDGEIVYECEFDLADYGHTLEHGIDNENILSPWAACSVSQVDVYYDGDHMVLAIDLF